MTRRLHYFIRDASVRSAWCCPIALTLFSIRAANAALMARFK